MLTGVDRPVAAAVLQAAAGVVVLASVLLLGSTRELALTLGATTTPVAVLVGAGLVACGVSVWAQPSTRVLAGVLGFALALVAVPAANLGGFVLGSVLGVLGSAAALSWRPGEADDPGRSEQAGHH